MFFVLSEMCCRPEATDGFTAIARLEFATRRTQDGHLGARVGRNLSEPSRLCVLEQWTCASAFHTYLNNPRASGFAAAIASAVLSGELHVVSGSRIVDFVGEASQLGASAEPGRPCVFLYEGTVRDTAAFAERVAELNAFVAGHPGSLFADAAVDLAAPDQLFGFTAWRTAADMRAAFADPVSVVLQQQLVALAVGMPRFRVIYANAIETQHYAADAQGRTPPSVPQAA